MKVCKCSRSINSIVALSSTFPTGTKKDTTIPLSPFGYLELLCNTYFVENYRRFMQQRYIIELNPQKKSSKIAQKLRKTPKETPEKRERRLANYKAALSMLV